MKSKPYSKIVILTVFLVVQLIGLPYKLKANEDTDSTFSKLYKKLCSAETDTAKINIMQDIAYCYENNRTDSCLKYAMQAYTLSNETGYEKVESANLLGYSYELISDYLSALEYYIEAYNEAIKTTDTQSVNLMLNSIGTNYLYLHEFEKALEYYTKALDYTCDYESKNRTMENLAQVYIFLEDYTKAQEYYNSLLKLAKKKNDNETVAYIYNRLGELYYVKEDDDKSVDYFKKSIEANTPDNTRLLIMNMLCIARSSLYTGKYNEGIKIALQVDSMAKAEKRIDNEMSNCYNLSSLYDSIGEHEIAYDYFQRYSILKDSIYQKEKIQQLNILKIKFETAQKESQIVALEREAKLTHTLNLVYIIVACLVLTILLFVVKYFRQKNKILAFEKEKAILKKKELRMKIFEKDRKILTHIMQIDQQKEALTTMFQEIENFRNFNSLEEVNAAVKKLNSNIKTKIDLCDDWDQIKLHFEKVHPDFFSGLKSDHADLTLNELKLCSYTKLKLNAKEISRLLNTTPDSIKTARYRLKKKLKIPSDISFDDYIEKC